MAELSEEYIQAIEWLEAHKPAPSAQFLQEMVNAHLRLLEENMILSQEISGLRKDLQRQGTTLKQNSYTLQNTIEEVREKEKQLQQFNTRFNNQHLMIKELQELKEKIRNFQEDIEPYFQPSDSSGN